MAQEIERKFLVNGTGWQDHVTRTVEIRQAYLARTPAMVIRVRIVDEDRALLTIKSARPGTTRSEFEYPIPLDDARRLMDLRSGQVLRKRRHVVAVGAHEWEVDVFGPTAASSSPSSSCRNATRRSSGPRGSARK